MPLLLHAHTEGWHTRCTTLTGNVAEVAVVAIFPSVRTGTHIRSSTPTAAMHGTTALFCTLAGAAGNTSTCATG